VVRRAQTGFLSRSHTSDPSSRLARNAPGVVWFGILVVDGMVGKPPPHIQPPANRPIHSLPLVPKASAGRWGAVKLLDVMIGAAPFMCSTIRFRALNDMTYLIWRTSRKTLQTIWVARARKLLKLPKTLRTPRLDKHNYPRPGRVNTRPA